MGKGLKEILKSLLNIFGDPRSIEVQKDILDVIDPFTGNIKGITGGGLGTRRNFNNAGEVVLKNSLFQNIKGIKELLKSEEGKEKLKKIVDAIKKREIEPAGLLGAIYITEGEKYTTIRDSPLIQALYDFTWVAIAYQMAGPLGDLGRKTGAMGLVEKVRVEQLLNTAIEKILNIEGFSAVISP